MTRRTFLGIICLVLFSAACPAVLRAAESPEAAAQKSAEAWLAQIDEGHYGESWIAAASFFQSALTQAQWEQSLTAVRQPLGALVSRKLKSATYAKTLPGAPDGEYVVLQFETSFANKKEAIETVTPMREKDGTWKVSGYFIK